MEVHVVPGNHMVLLRSPFVETFAKELQIGIDRARQRYSTPDQESSVSLRPRKGRETISIICFPFSKWGGHSNVLNRTSAVVRIARPCIESYSEESWIDSVLRRREAG